MILQFDDFPLLSVYGAIQSRTRGQIAYVSDGVLAADIVMRLNRDYFGQFREASWGSQPEGFEKMLVALSRGEVTINAVRRDELAKSSAT